MKAQTKSVSILGMRGFAAMIFSLAASPVLNEAGISFGMISAGFGTYYLILALAEIPTGAWADIFGAKKSAIIGGLLQVCAQVLYAFPHAFPGAVLVGFALGGFAASFVSGAHFLLYGYNKDADGKDFNSNRYFSVIEKGSVASYIIASASIGFLSKYLATNVFLVCAVVYLGSIIITALLVHEGPKTVEHKKKLHAFIPRIREGFSFIFKNNELRYLLPVRMLHQVETILGILWLPWIKVLGGGSSLWFSVLATGSYLARYGVNHWLATKKAPTSYIPRIRLALLIMAVGSLVCVFAVNVWVGLIGVWITASARGAFLPAVQAIQHEALPEKIRATGLSVMNFSTEIMYAMVFFVSSSVIDHISPSVAWGIAAACFGVAAIMKLGLDRKKCKVSTS